MTAGRSYRFGNAGDEICCGVNASPVTAMDAGAAGRKAGVMAVVACNGAGGSRAAAGGKADKGMSG